jgi:hypothetical protein
LDNQFVRLVVSNGEFYPVQLLEIDSEDIAGVGTSGRNHSADDIDDFKIVGPSARIERIAADLLPDRALSRRI